MNSAEWLIKQARQLPDGPLESVVSALVLELLDRALQRPTTNRHEDSDEMQPTCVR